jgi:hypothetical protein
MLFTFSSFLESEGDFDIKLSEWEPYNETITEDLTRSTFDFKRSCTYLHPRTSMLMFGPKNATARQIQYLSVPGYQGLKTRMKQAVGSEDLEFVKSGLIVTVTQFEGIPMSDVFKVLQYWAFESNDSKTPNCFLRMSCAIHLCKSTMLKSQICAGTKEELAVQVKKYVAFALNTIAEDSEDKGEAKNGEDNAAPNTVRRSSIRKSITGDSGAAEGGTSSATPSHRTSKAPRPDQYVATAPAAATVDNKLYLVLIIMCLVVNILILLYLIFRMNKSDQALIDLANSLIEQQKFIRDSNNCLNK